LALRAGIGHHAPHADARRAALANREKTLLHTDLAGARAGRARLEARRSIAPAATATRCAALSRLERNGLLATEGGFGEPQLERVTYIAPLRLALLVSAEQVAEQSAEQILHACERGSAHESILGGGHAEPIVVCALIGIGQHGVGGRHPFELLFGPGIARILVGVVLERQATIRGLDLFGGGVALEAEPFVVVA